jgi:putative phosphoribosyl transferase
VSRGDRQLYHDREDAGRALADALSHLAGRTDLVVLALPRGGVPVAAPVVARLGGTLGVLVVRKIGVPGRPELAMGALASVGGRTTVVTNDSVLSSLGIATSTFDRVAQLEAEEAGRRVSSLGGEPVSTRDRTVVVVDDGLATGSTMLAAVRALRPQRPAAIVVAVPVGAREAVQQLSKVADEVTCPRVPEPFLAVGMAYQNFAQVSDDEVRRLLHTGARPGS